MNLKGNLGAEVEDEEGNEDKEDQMGNKKIRVDTFKQNNNRRVNPIQGMESES